MQGDTTPDTGTLAWIFGGVVALCVMVFRHISPFHVVSKAINMALEEHLSPLKRDISHLRAVVDEMPGAKEAQEIVRAKKERWGT